MIVEEVNGNKINKDILYDMVINAILKGEKTIDLEAKNCYENPQYTSTSQEVIKTKDMLNKYIGTKIIYTFGCRLMEELEFMMQYGGMSLVEIYISQMALMVV